RPELSAAIHPGGSSTSGPVSVDHTDVALGASITTFKTIREIAEGLPIPCNPLKATCSTLKNCEDNREGWRERAEVMEEENWRIASLLRLYPQEHKRCTGALDQANKYLRKRDTEASDGLENYWETMNVWGREAALSRINAEKISGYKGQLRDQALNVMEVVGIQNAMDLSEISDGIDGASANK
ncbi:hypothetical protein CPB86DRAFT_803301, partial [Serendipita vermifera]